jgi:cytochrome P450
MKYDARRMSMTTTRHDFFSNILRNGVSDSHDSSLKEKKVMSRAEIHSNAYLLIMAGSETSATALSGLIYYLCLTPSALSELNTEIRSTFSASDAITFSSTSKLKYLNACIEEGLRIYSPVAHGLSRVPPPGGELVDGYFVPEGVSVLYNSNQRMVLIC